MAASSSQRFASSSMDLQAVGTALGYINHCATSEQCDLWACSTSLARAGKMLVSYRPLAMSQPCLRLPIDASREERLLPGPSVRAGEQPERQFAQTVPC